jgi:hypothetical protein
LEAWRLGHHVISKAMKAATNSTATSLHGTKNLSSSAPASGTSP